jgi:hypothetical protein
MRAELVAAREALAKAQTPSAAPVMVQTTSVVRLRGSNLNPTTARQFKEYVEGQLLAGYKVNPIELMDETARKVFEAKLVVLQAVGANDRGSWKYWSTEYFLKMLLLA